MPPRPPPSPALLHLPSHATLSHPPLVVIPEQRSEFPVSPSAAGRRQFAHHEWAQKAAYLLGCSLEELSSSIFKHQAKGLQNSTSFRGGPDESGQGDGAGEPTYSAGRTAASPSVTLVPG